jgi:hypothetical protein
MIFLANLLKLDCVKAADICNLIATEPQLPIPASICKKSGLLKVLILKA